MEMIEKLSGSLRSKRKFPYKTRANLRRQQKIEGGGGGGVGERVDKITSSPKMKYSACFRLAYNSSFES